MRESKQTRMALPLAASRKRGHCPSVVLYLGIDSQRSHFTESWQSLLKVIMVCCTFLSVPKHYFLICYGLHSHHYRHSEEYCSCSRSQAKLGSFLLLVSMLLSGSNVVEATMDSLWVRLVGLNLMEENSDSPQPRN